MKKILFLGIFLAIFGKNWASFCGDSAVPYSFEALPNGQPVLGCARPACFGWNSEGKKAGSSAYFYRINWVPDGHFVQSNDTSRIVPLSVAPNFKPQIARCFLSTHRYDWKILCHKSGRKFKVLESDFQKSGIYEIQDKGTRLYYGQTRNSLRTRLTKHLCKTNRSLKEALDKGVVPEVRLIYDYSGNQKTLELAGKRLIQRNSTSLNKCSPTYDSEQCSTKNQWVGGISPMVNPKLPILLQCCEYDKLELSEDQGVAVVNAGQIVVGGEIVKNGRQYAFDYISDVMKHVDVDGNVTYDVSIRRFPCLPYPSEFSIDVDESVKTEIISKFEKVGKTSGKSVTENLELKKPFKIQASTTIKIRPINSDPMNGAQMHSNNTVRIYPVKTAPQPMMPMFNMGLPYPAVPNPVVSGPFKAETDDVPYQ